jgi:hypothetical protein
MRIWSTKLLFSKLGSIMIGTNIAYAQVKVEVELEVKVEVLRG